MKNWWEIFQEVIFLERNGGLGHSWCNILAIFSRELIFGCKGVCSLEVLFVAKLGWNCLSFYFLCMIHLCQDSNWLSVIGNNLRKDKKGDTKRRFIRLCFEKERKRKGEKLNGRFIQL